MENQTNEKGSNRERGNATEQQRGNTAESETFCLHTPLLTQTNQNQATPQTETTKQHFTKDKDGLRPAHQPNTTEY